MCLSGLAKELGIERDVVGNEVGIAQPGSQFGQHLPARRRGPNHVTVDAVDANRTDPEPPTPPWGNQAGPAIEHQSGAIDHHQADLQDMMPTQ